MASRSVSRETRGIFAFYVRIGLKWAVSCAVGVFCALQGEFMGVFYGAIRV